MSHDDVRPADPPDKAKPKPYSWAARIFLGTVIVFGLATLAQGALTWESSDTARFGCYLAVATAASIMKIWLPSMKGTMSVSFFFTLIGIVELSLPETLAIGFVSTISQYLWKARARPRMVPMLFNIGLVTVATAVGYLAFQTENIRGFQMQFAMRLMVTACLYFVMNTLPVAIVINLTERRPLIQTWRNTYFWAFAYYLVGAATAGFFKVLSQSFGWQTAILILPVVYIVYRSYNLYLTKLAAEKVQADTQRAHAEEVSALHLRTIEALAMAIEAKDQNTHDHLHRVQTYCLEAARTMNLPPEDVQAILAASLLHDIGKLAVPEHIISKPGKLAPEEFEKMKIHPVVGAEILERVQFPYRPEPVVPWPRGSPAHVRRLDPSPAARRARRGSRGAARSAHAMQGAELVAGRIAQIGEIHLPQAAFAHSRGVFAGRPTVGDAGRVPRVHRGRIRRRRSRSCRHWRRRPERR